MVHIWVWLLTRVLSSEMLESLRGELVIGDPGGSMGLHMEKGARYTILWNKDALLITPT